MSRRDGVQDTFARSDPLLQRYSPHLYGAIVGLYGSRIIAEGTAAAWPTGIWPWRFVLPLILMSVLVGAGLGALLLWRLDHRWPLLILGVYIVWPWSAPALALATAGVAAITLGILNMLAGANVAHTRWGWLALAVTVVGLALYITTLAPGLLPADSGEFQLVGAVLGIAHPPGYPLYTMLGHLMTRLPLGTPAQMMNLFGALCGALTLGVVVWSLSTVSNPARISSARQTGAATAAVVAAGALAVAPTFWAQSTTANIRSLTALFTALMLGPILYWQRHRQPRNLTLFGLAAGMAIGHHASLALLLPALGLFILTVEPGIMRRPRRWLGGLAAFVLAFAVLLYLPIRSATGAPFDPSPIRSLEGFLDHVLARGFGGDMFHYRTAATLLPRARVWLEIIRLQFGWPLTLTILGVWIVVLRQEWRVALLLAGAWALNTLAAITYRAPQTVEYLLPSYVAMALILGYGLILLWRQTALKPGAPGIATALLLVLVIHRGVTRYASFEQLHHDGSTRAWAETILREAPPDALILSSWHRATPLWYLQQVEGQRPDVEVRYVYPEGATPNEAVWLRQIDEHLDQRPVVVTNRYYAYEHTDYRWIPLGGAWLVRRDPLPTVSQGITSVEAEFSDDASSEARIRLLGYELGDSSVTPGDTLHLRVYWQPLQPLERDYSTFVQLVGPDGVIGQGDIIHDSTTYLPGEVRVDAYTIPLLLHTFPDTYRLITGFYYGIDGGWKRLVTDQESYVALTDVAVRPATAPATARHPLDWRYANGLQLVGSEIDDGIAGQRRLYLHWWHPNHLTARRTPPKQAQVQAWQHGILLGESLVPPLAPGQAATVALDLPDVTGPVTLHLIRTDNGGRIPRLGPWHRPFADGSVRLDNEQHRFVPLGGKMAYIGLANEPERLTIGETAWLSPRLMALQPLTHDYSVSVGLRSHGWESKSDGTPARGAIPTLKWIKGWVVTDPHRMVVDDRAPAGPAEMTLTVYDVFTLEPLQILDERLVRQGQGITLQLGEVEVTTEE